MHIKEFLKKNNLTETVMADEIGVSLSYLSKLITGDRRPSDFLIKKIIDYTNGDVSKDDLYFSMLPSHCPCCGKLVGQSRMKSVANKLVESRNVND